MTVVQPFVRPATIGEYEAMRSRMIDTLGRPLELRFCAECSTPHFTVEPHVREVPCPDCGSTRTRCVRPSAHDAAEWHKARRDAFDRLCTEREAAGIAQVARWPEIDLAQFELEASALGTGQ